MCVLKHILYIIKSLFADKSVKLRNLPNAENYVETLPEPIEGSTAETIADAIAEQQALDSEMDTTSYKVKSVISKEWANDSVKKEVLKETSSKRKIK